MLDHGLTDEWHHLTGQLDAQGRFSANFDPPPAYQFTFQVTAPDAVSALWRWHHLDPGEERDLGSMRLERPCTLNGLVLNDDGEAATRRRWAVTARSPETASNDGREPIVISATTTEGTSAYRLDGLPAGPVEVTVWERQYGRTRPVVTRLLLDQENSLNLTVPGIEEADRRVTLYASVASYASTILPALDAIRLQAEDGHEQVARERGNNQLGFRFDRVGPGAHRLVIDDPRFERHVLEGVHHGDSLSVQLRGSAALVFDWKTEGERDPPDDYSVEVRYEKVSFFPRNFRPHKKGRLQDDVLMGMVPGDYSIVVRAGEFLGFASVPDLKPGERRSVAMSLQPPHEVRGRVLRQDGSPVVGGLVRLVRPAEVEDTPNTTILGPNSMSSHPKRMRQEVDRRQTDAEGSFVFRPERHGRFLLVAGSDGGLRTESPVFELGEKARVEEFELVLARSASLSGRVVGVEGLDLSGWAVAYIREDDPLSFQRTRQPLGPGGDFEWPEIRPGEVSLYLLRPQEWPSLHADLSPSNGKLLGELALTSGQAATAELEYPGELPAHVTWERLGGAANFLAEEAWILGQDSKVALPLSMGSKRIGPAWLDEGRYRLYLTGDRWLYRAEEFLQVTQSATLEGPRENNMISGRIRLLHGDQPLVGADVSLFFTDLEGVMGPLTPFETDQDGWFDLTASPGTLRIWITAKEHPGARLDPFPWPLTGEDRTLRVR